tara:strand:+ start:3603 stop:4358 length:756 start_codon:yes stop_codon:yes gene_type:complete
METIKNTYELIIPYYSLLHKHFQKNIKIEHVNHMIKKYISFNNNTSKLLDIGCGTGIYTNLFGQYFNKTYGIDITDGMIDKCINENNNKNISYFCTDIHDFNYNNFDMIISISQVLNHIPNHTSLEKFFDLVYDKLNTNGLFIFDIFNSNFIINNNYGSEKRVLTKNCYYTIKPVVNKNINQYCYNLKLNNTIHNFEKKQEYTLDYNVWYFDYIKTIIAKKNFKLIDISNMLTEIPYNDNDCKITFVIKKI